MSTVTAPLVTKSPVKNTSSAESIPRDAISASAKVTELFAGFVDMVRLLVPSKAPKVTPPSVTAPVVSISTVPAANVVRFTPLRSTLPSTTISPASSAVSESISTPVGSSPTPIV